MSPFLFALALAAAALAAILIAVRWARMRGTRVITCPETHEPAAVEVDAAHAVLTSIFSGTTDYQLTECSRWPDRAGCGQAGCGQECVVQIRSAANHCLVRAILADWYLGRECAFCHTLFSRVEWHDHHPALYDPDQKKTLEWTDVRPELVHQVLATFQPVCWNCHLAETFRREHPDLVTDRRPSRLRAM